jgi:hypothetical protein
MGSPARRIIDKELPRGPSPGSRGRAAFRACEQLREPLTAYAGAIGFRSLLRRALSLARAEEPWLVALQVNDAGVVIFPANFESALDSKAAARAGEALVEQLLQLLETFIGQALTLRLVYEVWPTAVAKASKTREIIQL